jgi:Protein of unknown function (DUF4043)
MGNVATLNTTTYASATAVNAKVVGEAFSKILMVSSTTKDVFGQFEGPENSRSAVIVKDDLNKMAGQLINFTVSANAGHMPVRGEVSLRGKEEKPRVNSFQIKIDFVRHAISFNKKVQAFLAAGMSLNEAYAEVLADHFGRFKETDMKMTLRNKATPLNTVSPGNKQYNNMNSLDVVDTVLLGEALGNLTMLGAKEIKTTKSVTGAAIYRYMFFGTTNCLKALKSNATYAAAVQNTINQSRNNVIFDGGYVDWDGQGIYNQAIVDPDADGPLGDPLEPRAVLGTAVTAADTAVVLDGGGLNGPDPTLRAKYFRWFRGYDYQWTEGQTAAPDSNTYYFVIWNVTGAAAGKFGVYSYVGTANSGDQITTTNRLRAAAAGTSVASLAGQAWNAAIHTDSHPAGSIIIQVNAKCVPIGWLLGLGVGAGLRAYGGNNEGSSMRRIAQNDDYDFEKGQGYEAVWGQDVSKDTNLQPRNYCLMPVAYTIPGMSLPSITT